MTEDFETGSKKVGRGMARASIDLIEKMADIAEEAQPITGRGIGYKLFTAGLIASMATHEMARVYRLLKEARERGLIPWESIVDETRALERVATCDDPEEYVSAAATAGIFGSCSRCASKCGRRRAPFAACSIPYLIALASVSARCTAFLAPLPCTMLQKTTMGANSLFFTSATSTPAGCACRTTTCPTVSKSMTAITSCLSASHCVASTWPHTSGIGAFDVDDCRDTVSGQLHPRAQDLLDRCNSYAEITPSGTGIRIIGRMSGPALHRKFAVPGAEGMSVEIYRDAERIHHCHGDQIGDGQLANIDAQADALVVELERSKETKKANGTGRTRKHHLECLISDGCGEDFGGDRSRAVWYVINQLLKKGRAVEDIMAVLLDRNNGISAHVYDQTNPEVYARRQVEKAQQESACNSDVDTEINQLAGLSPVQYERERKAAAERLNVCAAILDKLVLAERPDDDEGKQGRAISFPEPEPWPEPVDGAALLDVIAEAIGRHVVMPEHSRNATALWVTHTYLLDCFICSPRLAICSPMKRCEKTTLLDVIGGLVLKPLPTANVTAAAVFRVVEGYRPALLVDEADTFLKDNDELRGVINSGHRKGGSVLRTVGDDHEPRAFSTYSACAIALIGKLPDTLHDRAVAIDLKRRLPSEKIESFRSDRTGHLDVLARKAARWAADNAIRAADLDPEKPAGLYNREADNWQPLLTIADAVGGHWPERARKAALQGRKADDDDYRTVLLGDVKAIFTERDTDRLLSAQLVKGLVDGHDIAKLKY